MTVANPWANRSASWFFLAQLDHQRKQQPTKATAMKNHRSRSTTTVLVLPESLPPNKHKQQHQRLDDSWSSTVPVHLNDQHPDNKPYKSLSDQEGPSLHVHFDESLNEIYEDTGDVRYTDVCNSWYTKEDYVEFDQDIDFILQSFHDFQHNLQVRGEDDPDSFAPVLSDVYYLCCDVHLEREQDFMKLLSMSDEDDDVSSDDEPQEESYASLGSVLRHLYQDDEFNLLLIGLEKYLVESIVQGRRDRRVTILRWIQELQKQDWQSPDELAQALRQVSVEVSRPARLLAQCLAQAQMGYRNEDHEQGEGFCTAGEEEESSSLEEDETIDDDVDDSDQGLDLLSFDTVSFGSPVGVRPAETRVILL